MFIVIYFEGVKETEHIIDQKYNDAEKEHSIFFSDP